MRNLVIAIENSNKEDKSIYKEAINVSYASYRKVSPDVFGLNVQYNHDLALKDIRDAVAFTQLLPNIIQNIFPQQLRMISSAMNKCLSGFYHEYINLS